MAVCRPRPLTEYPQAPTLDNGVRLAAEACAAIVPQSGPDNDTEAMLHSLVSMAYLTHKGLLHVEAPPASGNPSPNGTPAELLAEALLHLFAVCEHQEVDVGDTVTGFFGFRETTMDQMIEPESIEEGIDEIVAGLRRARDLSEFMAFPVPVGDDPDAGYTNALHRHITYFVGAYQADQIDDLGDDFCALLCTVLDYDRVCEHDIIGAFEKRLRMLLGSRTAADSPV